MIGLWAAPKYYFWDRAVAQAKNAWCEKQYWCSTLCQWNVNRFCRENRDDNRYQGNSKGCACHVGWHCRVNPTIGLLIDNHHVMRKIFYSGRR
jgi:hypothetical protein